MPLPLWARTVVGTATNKNKVKNAVTMLFIALPRNEIEARDSDFLPVRSRLSHAAFAAHTARRFACSHAHVAPSAHAHPIHAHQAGHGLGHHLWLRWMLLAVPHPARLTGFQQHLVLRLEQVR